MYICPTPGDFYSRSNQFPIEIPLMRWGLLKSFLAPILVNFVKSPSLPGKWGERGMTLIGALLYQNCPV